ncbi:MAG TPA: hypothetical protein DEB50_06660 [Desulfobacter sp.]|nr:hypothetical protein [Desulfobacter sp.]
MGIKIFLSSFTLRVLLAYKSLYPNAEMNVLLSFGTRSQDYYNMIITYRDMISSLICDSGAFTKNFANAKTAAKISLDGFIAFAKQPFIRKAFDFIFNYDENFNLDGFETNLRNMWKMKNADIDSVPVVHDYLGVVFNEIEYYLQKGYKLIALGYSEHKMTDGKDNIQAAVSRIVSKGSRVHLLGISSYDILADNPIHYSDSSSWAQEGLYGNILWWNPNKPSKGENKTDRIRFLDRENSHKRHNRHIGNYPYVEELQVYLKDQLGMTLLDLCGHDKEFNRQLVNVHFFVELQDRVREAHRQRGIILK